MIVRLIFRIIKTMVSLLSQFALKRSSLENSNTKNEQDEATVWKVERNKIKNEKKRTIVMLTQKVPTTCESLCCEHFVVEDQFPKYKRLLQLTLWCCMYLFRIKHPSVYCRLTSYVDPPPPLQFHRLVLYFSLSSFVHRYPRKFCSAG